MTLHALIEMILSPYDGQTVEGRARVAVNGQDIQIANGSVTSLGGDRPQSFDNIDGPGGTLEHRARFESSLGIAF
jgi:hypothetical protein